MAPDRLIRGVSPLARLLAMIRIARFSTRLQGARLVAPRHRGRGRRSIPRYRSVWSVVRPSEPVQGRLHFFRLNYRDGSAPNQKEQIRMLNNLVIQVWLIEKIRPYGRALRRNQHAIDRMVAAIREFGCKIPLLVRGDGELIDGDLRLKAARQMGLTELPVIVCDEWTPAQVKAFRLLVNRSATWASWNLDQVALELQEIQSLPFDLSLTGFEGLEIDGLLRRLRAEADDPDTRTPAHPITRAGDLWLCGPHRVLCGDATAAADVARLLGATIPVLMVTDPPYGVAYDPQWRERAGLGQPRQSGAVRHDDRADWTAAYRLFPGDVLYVFHAGLHAAAVATGIIACNFEIRSQIIWAKQHFALSRGHYHWQHEPCWYAVRQHRPSHWRGDRQQSTLWEVANLNPFGGQNPEEVPTGHGTQKPLELLRRPICNHTEMGEAVYDPFLGLGTTLLAAELAGRICYGLEIDPGYVDVILRRWQAVTGRQPRLDHDGRTFDEIQAERRPDASAELACGCAPMPADLQPIENALPPEAGRG